MSLRDALVVAVPDVLKRRSHVSNFYEGFYETYRGELVRFASQFDRFQDTAEDLFEDCHLALCDRYHDIAEIEYLKLMKTAIKNRYRDEYKEKKLVWTIPYVPDDMSLEECVIQRFEMEKVMLTMQELSKEDQSVLLSNNSKLSNQFRSKKNQAKLRLKNILIQKEVFPGNELIPLCPECDSKYMLFSMEDYAWTCDDCGAVTASPLLIPQKKKNIE